MTHTERSKQARVSTPCASWHMTFGGRCLNCGWVDLTSIRFVVTRQVESSSGREWFLVHDNTRDRHIARCEVQADAANIVSALNQREKEKV